jgi:hypothetical protein
MTAPVARYRHIVETEGVAALAELFEARLDAIAGPWSLTDTERRIQQACRQRYGIYNPTNAHQACFIARLNVLAADPTD